MTQRIKGLQVTFDRDIREDDAEAIINAILMLRGVLDVRPIESEPFLEDCSRTKIVLKLREKILNIIGEELNPHK